MNVIVNGESHEIANHATMADLLAQLDMSGQKLAVEINLDIVPRSTYSDHRLNDGDRIEIVRAIGGG
ncbi:MAG: sulfur carrier protein ThiS [Gammaproteobacteria bacterium]|nr:sulfur carrier protein ThiS [Gammaproteobacteria bacterium]MCP5136529.1 sulfur carrier protein ThiS [Gammaproteobacteria bacterium]